LFRLASVRRTLALALLAAVLVGLWLHRHHASRPRPNPPPPHSERLLGPSSAAVPSPGAAEPSGQPGQPGPVDAPSHLADELNSPAGDIRADLRIVNELFDQYRSATHGSNPVGENAEITAALAGKNKLGFAFIPPDHPAIDAKGELCDRWGTPFFFHSLSATQMEIRSAGPDRKMWTADDEVLTPGLYKPQL
jgi:hypothetical protein